MPADISIIKNKQTIGEFANVDFPELSLKKLQARVDTGAYYSAIHCRDIIRTKRGSDKLLSFTLLDAEHPLYNGKRYSVGNFKKIIVKNSFGETERRYVVELKVKLMGNQYIALFGLSDRKKMLHPVLLGRQLLAHQFIIDLDKKG